MDDQTKNDMSDLLDEAMLDYLKNGEPVLDKDGEPVRDEKGNILRKRTAAWMNAIRQRLKDAGVAASPTATNPIGQVMQELGKGRRPGLSFEGRPVGAVPPVDTEEPDAATGT